MSKRQFLIILGVWTMALLFLGFPAAWDKIFALVTGLMIIIAAFRSGPVAPASQAKHVPYVEHRQQDMRPRTAPQQMSQTDSIPNGTITSTDTTAS
jgi:hypothetical protein